MKEKCAAGILSPFYDLEANWRVNRGAGAWAGLSVKLHQPLSHSAESEHERLQTFLNRTLTD